MNDEKVAAKLMLGWVRDALTKAVAAERARCAAVCREVAAQAVGPLALDAGVRRGATTCAEAIERGAVAT
ncbi:MAG: hypothetical protein KBF56_10195 [Gemmatimonadaceae bacterium]|nr:hypothetical protein [Gemmatimonadaceae bacterium]